MTQNFIKFSTSYVRQTSLKFFVNAYYFIKIDILKFSPDFLIFFANFPRTCYTILSFFFFFFIIIIYYWLIFFVRSWLREIPIFVTAFATIEAMCHRT